MKKFSLSKSLKPAILPTLGLLLLTLLIFLGGNLLLSKISAVRQEVAELTEESSILNQKLQTLQDFNIDGSTVASKAALALPPTNSTLLAISQIRLRAVPYSVSVGNIKVGSGINLENGVSYADIEFEATAPLTALFQYLAAMRGVAPFNTVERVQVNDFSGITQATVIYRSYWADYPKSVPPASAPLTPFKESDTALLQSILSLEPPQVLDATPQGPSGSPKENPFGI